MIVPQAPGGTNDIVARVLAEELSRSLGQPFVVENRPGASHDLGRVEGARPVRMDSLLETRIESA